MAQGNLADALKSYSNGLVTREQLAKSDPGNAGWQRDLSVYYNKAGDVQMEQGDLAPGTRCEAVAQAKNSLPHDGTRPTSGATGAPKMACILRAPVMLA